MRASPLTRVCDILHTVPIPAETLPPRPLLRDDVLRRLRDAIVDGILAPQEQLRDGELAAWLGVSRTPVREALLELGRAGLVHAIPGRSTVVAPLEVGALRDAQAVVAAMHALAVRTAVPLLTADDLDRMRRASAAFDEAHRTGDVDGALTADAAFHAVTVERCGNAAARAVLDRYEPVLRRAERLRFASPHEGAASAARHAQLLERCAAGDADGAARIAEDIWHALITPAHPGTTTEGRTP